MGSGGLPERRSTRSSARHHCHARTCSQWLLSVGKLASDADFSIWPRLGEAFTGDLGAPDGCYRLCRWSYVRDVQNSNKLLEATCGDARASTMTLGRMKTTVVSCLLAGTALTSCSGSDSGNDIATEPDRVFSLCSFPATAAGRVGAKIRVRGRLTLHAHGLLLSDERCPDVRVHLDIAPDAPDFCGPELVQQLGCPPGAD